MSFTKVLPERGPVARQGHLYKHFGIRVLAMESGERVKVREVITDAYFLGPEFIARAEWLQPLPMKYFGNEVPT
jgi:hypothetical protein